MATMTITIPDTKLQRALDAFSVEYPHKATVTAAQNAKNQIINLYGKEKISVIDIVKYLEKILNRKAKINYIEDRAGQFKGRFISSNKAKELLNWEVTTNYIDTLKSYVDWFKKNEVW